MNQPSHTLSKPLGWFSRRYKSSAPHFAAQAAKEAKAEACMALVESNRKARALRSPQEQIALLDKHGHRAVKERARLLSQVEKGRG